MSQEFIIIGEIVASQGNKGEVKVVPLTNSLDRFKRLKAIFIRTKEGRRLLKIGSLRVEKKAVILSLEGIENIEEAKSLVGSFLEVKRSEAVKLPEDTYFIFEIIGSEVYTMENELLGKIEDIISTGSNDVYIVKSQDEKEILIPAIRDVVKEIDLKRKRVIIEAIEGLL